MNRVSECRPSDQSNDREMQRREIASGRTEEPGQHSTSGESGRGHLDHPRIVDLRRAGHAKGQDRAERRPAQHELGDDSVDVHGAGSKRGGPGDVE